MSMSASNSALNHPCGGIAEAISNRKSEIAFANLKLYSFRFNVDLILIQFGAEFGAQLLGKNPITHSETVNLLLARCTGALLLVVGGAISDQ